MKWLIAAMLLCLALAGIVSGAEQAVNSTSGCVGCNSNSANVTENQTEMFIFIQEGAGGSFVNDGSGNYTLTITNVVPYTVFFADRPARDVGFVPMDKFLEGFNFGTSNPPNAAIILPEENETSDQVIVKLGNPQYDNTTGTLSYNAKLLKEYSFKSGWLEDQRSKIDASIPERFGRVVLVIDSSFCGCSEVSSSACASQCRSSCWNLKHFRCEPCGGCCSANPCSCMDPWVCGGSPGPKHDGKHTSK